LIAPDLNDLEVIYDVNRIPGYSSRTKEIVMNKQSLRKTWVIMLLLAALGLSLGVVKPALRP
jgi:hypothetical protein